MSNELPDERPDENDALFQWSRRMTRALSDVDARIARLALFLDISLESETVMQQVIDHTHPLFLRYQHNPEVALTDDHGRERQTLEELRGLLVVRCNMVATMLNDLGLDATTQIASAAEDHLERLGFKPGADEFKLVPLRKP